VKKSLTYASALLLALFIIASISITAQGASYKVGVTSGDWAEYSEITSVSSSPIKVRIDIIAVSGTSVSLNETFYNTNGTVALRLPLNGDFAKPTGFLLLLFFLIPANLSAGDSISGFPYIINETIQMSVANTTRLCNHLSIHGAINTTSVAADYYWDQATGILAKSVSNIVSPSMTLSTTMVMTSTNIFTGGSGVSATIILVGAGVAVAAIAIVVVVAIYRSRRKST
jgi:hypothetical protein